MTGNLKVMKEEQENPLLPSQTSGDHFKSCNKLLSLEATAGSLVSILRCLMLSMARTFVAAAKTSSS